jgi:hypothetical protein
MTYRIIFWGNSPHSTNVFKIQKRIIRTMTKPRRRDSCRQLFKRLEILPLQSQYIFSVLLFVVKNKDLYTINQQIHSINTKPNINLHPPVCNLTVFWKGVYFSGIKFFNHLPLNTKSLSNEIKSFKPALKRFLNLHSFYSVEEYFKHTYNWESWFLNTDRWYCIHNLHLISVCIFLMYFDTNYMLPLPSSNKNN